MSYTTNQLRALARDNPQELIRIITSPNGDAKTLTSGAEILGEEVTDESIVIPAFRMLLRHSHAFVREGAMIGVGAFFGDTKPPRDILERLRVMATSDPLPANKEAASDLIKTFEKK
jgi:hypothetical protein